MCSAEPLRSKAVLHIMDGMRQVWHGGPLTQVQDFIDQAGILLVATDPVALDTIELEAIEKKRSEKGAPSVWQHDPASITGDNHEFFHDPMKNLFYRQPGHIAAAGKLGRKIHSNNGRIRMLAERSGIKRQVVMPHGKSLERSDDEQARDDR